MKKSEIRKKILKLRRQNVSKNLNIDFSTKMLKWPKGITKDFGIWHSHWYHDVINSTEFRLKI